jgi:hypothetical protein
VAGVVTNGLCSEAKAVGLFGDYLETTVKVLVAKAVALNMNLTVYEDRQVASNINEKLADFLTFSVPDATSIVIDHTDKTVTMNVPNGTTMTALVATFTTTNSATVKISSTAQVSGVTQNNFSSPKTYRVTAKDTITYKDYTVTITELPS